MRNRIQQERMRGFFIDAATMILKDEGPAGISARNVAARAGYSYATLYNYFKDINELVFACLNLFCDECSYFVKNDCQGSNEGVEQIKCVTRAYAKYFLQNPGIFELFFVHKASDKSYQGVALANDLLKKLTRQSMQLLIENEQLKPEKAENINNQLLFSTTGMLLLFLNRNYPRSFSEFVSQLDEMLDSLFMI